jgi:hypothetical protein
VRRLPHSADAGQVPTSSDALGPLVFHPPPARKSRDQRVRRRHGADKRCPTRAADSPALRPARLTFLSAHHFAPVPTPVNSVLMNRASGPSVCEPSGLWVTTPGLDENPQGKISVKPEFTSFCAIGTTAR